MKIGIKYCGGCNPTYDRGASVAALKEQLSDCDVSFVSYDEKTQFDYCLLVRGCNRSCVSEREFSNCRHFYVAASKEEFLETKTKLYDQIQKDLHTE